VGLRGEIDLVVIFPKQARIRAAGVEFCPARPLPKKKGRECLQSVEVRGPGCRRLTGGRAGRSAEGSLLPDVFRRAAQAV